MAPAAVLCYKPKDTCMCYLKTRNVLLQLVADKDIIGLLALLDVQKRDHAVQWSNVMHNGSRHDIVKYVTLGSRRNRLTTSKKQSVIYVGDAFWALVAKVSWSRKANKLTSIDESGALCRVTHVFVDTRIVVVDPISIEMLFNVILGINKSAPWAAHVVGCLYASSTLNDSAVVVMHRFNSCVRRWKHSASIPEIRSVVFQVAAVLYILHDRLQFRHNDLHDGNVVVQTKKNGSAWEGAARLYYNMKTATFEIPNLGVRAALCDFGLSIMSFGGLHLLRVEYMRCSSAEKVSHLKRDCYKDLMTQPHMHEGVDLQTFLRSMMDGLHGRRLRAIEAMYDRMTAKINGVHTTMAPMEFLHVEFADWIVEKNGVDAVCMIDMNTDSIV